MSMLDRQILYHIRDVLLIALGVWLVITGLQFAGLSETEASSTKAEHAITGAAIGAGVGLGTYLLIGGIGVVTGGIGFAVGGAALTAIGFGAGGLFGAATGTTTIVVFSYPTWLWVTLIVLGCIILYTSYGQLRMFVERVRQLNVNKEQSALPRSLSGSVLRFYIVLMLIFGAILGSYASTFTQRRSPPTPDLDNVVFKDNGLWNRGKEQLLWSGRTKQIVSKWDGYHLKVEEMTFKDRDGKWVEE